MSSPPVTARAAARVEAYGVVGDGTPSGLVGLAELAALVCEVPAVGVHLVTEAGPVAVATYGAEAAPCEVAAQRLCTPDGITVGALVLGDHAPRTLTEDQRRALGTLADRVVDLLELGRRTAQLDAARVAGPLGPQRLDRFAERAAHDLRNPLTAASMSLQMLREQAGDEEATWLVERALSGVERADALIERLVEYAKAGTGLRWTRVTLTGLVARVRTDLEPLLVDADLRVEGPLPALSGDPEQLGVALAHLVSNAVLATRPVRAPVVVITADPIARGWRVEVADNGPGVPPEDRERMFEPLVRADKRRGGAGLGLAVCRRIVAAHGGATGLAESAAGGALAWLELPAAEDGELRLGQVSRDP